MDQLTEFKITYDGASLQDHSMEVFDLAPALLALGTLFDEANKIVNGDKVSIKLQVKAYETGSFEVYLVLSQSLLKQISNFLQGDFVVSLLNLKELIFLSGGGLFWLIKKLKGKKPDQITDLNNGLIRLEFEKESFEVPLALLRIYQDLTIRQTVEAVLKPLHKNGIDTFKVKDNNEIVETVTKDDLSYFFVPEIPEEEIACSEYVKAYSIVSLAFKDDNKWRLSDGNGVIVAAILDEEFQRKVNESLVSFSKGDILRCRVRTKQWRTIAGLKTEHEVLEVKEHIPAAKQMRLF